MEITILEKETSWEDHQDFQETEWAEVWVVLVSGDKEEVVDLEDWLEVCLEEDEEEGCKAAVEWEWEWEAADDDATIGSK